MTKTPFNIFDELSNWGKTLPIWQRCLLTKLVNANQLSDTDIDQVYSELLIDKRLADHSGSRIDYVVALPQFQNSSPQTHPQLRGMGSVLGVNALAPGNELAFGKNLTVIYGPNGSGKSGYARVLKAACFTRSHETQILGDVRREKFKQPKPTAKFTFDDGTSITYVYREACPRMRDNFAVFDSTCIRVHLDERNTFQVMPYLFDVFPRMVEAFEKLQKKLREQIAIKSPPADKFAIPNSDSTIARTLASLTAKTDLSVLKPLAIFEATEIARLEEVGKKIDELRSIDPKQLIKNNQLKISDLQSLLTSLERLSVSVTDELMLKVNGAIAKTTQLTQQSAALSAAQFGDEPVQPVGSLAWRELITAAIAYNDEAYSGNTFPPHVSEARCVLCQQELNTDAVNRLTRFYQVTTSDIEAQLAASKIEIESLGKNLRKIKTGFFDAENTHRRTLKELDAVLEDDVSKYISAHETLIQNLLDSLTNLITTVGKPPIDKISKRIQELSQRLVKENDDLVKKDPNILIAALQTEQNLLQDRKILTTKYPEIAAAITDLQWSTKAGTCLQSFSTVKRDVTTKQKALTKNLVTQGFIDLFTENCAALKLELPVQFRFAGDAGTTDRKIEITNMISGSFDPSDVLSEGEQTAAALADFLTEIEINGSCAGVIFDDPVTSMDHMRKESIAQRLADEAGRRQVIVFTHDILFTTYLATAADAKGINFNARTMWKNELQEPGSVDLLAFPHEHYEGAAHDRAKKYLNEANGAIGDKQHDLLEKACGSLRTAYEDFIQKKLFNNVVKRWRENMAYTLDQVYFDEEIALRVHERMEALSRFIDAHSHSPDHQEIPLTAQFITSELGHFDKIKSDYKTARKKWEESKPSANYN